MHHFYTDNEFVTEIFLGDPPHMNYTASISYISERMVPATEILELNISATHNAAELWNPLQSQNGERARISEGRWAESIHGGDFTVEAGAAATVHKEADARLLQDANRAENKVHAGQG